MNNKCDRFRFFIVKINQFSISLCNFSLVEQNEIVFISIFKELEKYSWNIECVSLIMELLHKHLKELLEFIARSHAHQQLQYAQHLQQLINKQQQFYDNNSNNNINIPTNLTTTNNISFSFHNNETNNSSFIGGVMPSNINSFGVGSANDSISNANLNAFNSNHATSVSSSNIGALSVGFPYSLGKYLLVVLELNI